MSCCDIARPQRDAIVHEHEHIRPFTLRLRPLRNR
jgi:hypothetical protein